MEYRILGPLEVVDDGRQLALGGTRQRALLAILLLHANEVVSTDRLVEELWGENPPETGPKALQVAVSQLRKTLRSTAGDDGRLLTRSPGYLLQVDPGELDRDRFDRLVAEATAEPDARKRAAKLREALALWRGQPLADLTYENFAAPAIARLEEARLAALEDRIDADLEAGQDAALVGELEELVARHPLRERLRGELMLALYRSGRQADALAVYHYARRTLIEELGVEPGPELQQLQRSILAHDPELGGARRPRPPGLARLEPRRRRRFPLALGVLVGAGAVLAAVLLAMRGGGSEPVVVPPDSVAVIDPRSDEVVEAIPVGNSPGPIDIESNTVWVVNINDATISRIDAEDRQVIGSTGFTGGNSPSIAVLSDGGSAWLGSTESTEIETVFLGRAGEVTTLNIGDPTTSGVASLVLDGESLLVADQGGALLEVIDQVSPRIGSRIELSRRPEALAVGGGLAWLANQGRTVSRVDLATGRITEVQVGDRPTAVAVDEGAVWVANGSDGTMSRITPSPLGVAATIEVGRDPTAVAVGEGAVWVANGGDGTVSRIDPETNEVVETIEVGHRPLGVAVGNGLVWVTVRS
jgi:YVTN family beta-propeller protein